MHVVPSLREVDSRRTCVGAGVEDRRLPQHFRTTEVYCMGIECQFLECVIQDLLSMAIMMDDDGNGVH